jgi:hypothetical protein
MADPDKIVADIDRKQNEEDKGLPKRIVKAAINLVKPKATKPDTGETTNPMGDKYAKGGKVKKFNDGGVSLEEKYPGAKVTRAGPQPKPEEYSANRIKVDEPFDSKKEKGDRADSRTLAPYERKAEKMEKRNPSRGSGGAGGDFSGMKGLDKPFKAGGKVGSASKRADGCAIRGKTKA